jgi:hypothetical protein
MNWHSWWQLKMMDLKIGLVFLALAVVVIAVMILVDKVGD